LTQEGLIVTKQLPSIIIIVIIITDGDLVPRRSKLLNGLSTPHIAGEMYTSAAPYDPTFWLIHPTAEVRS
jgi:hypothetical protein